MLKQLIPYRLVAYLDTRRVTRALRGIRRSPSIQCTPPTEADAELHMLICRRDILPALVALKSLLRFPDVKVSVTLTDDGSLTKGDRDLVSKQIMGCRWLSSGEPSVREALSNHGFDELLCLYDSDFKLAPKLIHPLFASSHNRIIVLDPDTAFFSEPRQLIRWLQKPERSLYSRDNTDQRDELLDPRVRDAFDRLRDHLGVANWQIKHHYFNSGFLAFSLEQCELRLADGFLGWRRRNAAELDFPGSSIWFGHWTAEQAAFMVMYAAMNPAGESFGPEYRLATIGETFSHFMRAGLVRPDVLRRLSALCEEVVHDLSAPSEGMTGR